MPDMEKLTREDAVRLLRDRAETLAQAGETRFPKRSDFTEREVVAIKALLGPWPRALEAAGLKAPRSDGRADKTRERRIRAKRLRTAAKKESKLTDG